MSEQISDESWGGAGSNRLEQVVEALAFAAEHPVSAIRIAEIFGEVTGQDRPSEHEVTHAVETLNERYGEQDRPLRIQAWGGGFRMATIPEVAPYIKELFDEQKQRRLTRSLLETLAILAYRQPATKPEIEFVRGVDCGYALRRLMELSIIDVVGRSESVGHPLLYGTTPRFLELFGLNSVDDLPNLREIETILDDPAFHKERALLLMKNGLSELRPGGDGAPASDAVEGMAGSDTAPEDTVDAADTPGVSGDSGPEGPETT
ncbi:MAG: SMC-Scp complex subunit ScpB [Rhodothermales bacterium]|nr:SMC-Scp complex subunit ScpB [Rhodothermales bacterium]MBO6781609.1 SMC-Scp complex subunit ScpB [Rhodothermales bacterium]